MRAHAFDWPGLLGAGLHVLRLRPAEFWALTPAELSVMLGAGSRSVTPMGRSRFEDLCRAHPDHRPDRPLEPAQ